MTELVVEIPTKLLEETAVKRIRSLERRNKKLVESNEELKRQARSDKYARETLANLRLMLKDYLEL